VTAKYTEIQDTIKVTQKLSETRITSHIDSKAAKQHEQNEHTNKMMAFLVANAKGTNQSLSNNPANNLNDTIMHDHDINTCPPDPNRTNHPTASNMTSHIHSPSRNQSVVAGLVQ
jgi:hypothetical protein